MREAESENGKLTPIDQAWTGPRFVAVVAATLIIAFSIIYTAASIKRGDFSYHPFAHDLVKHTLESSTIGR